jgi:ribosomal protein S18 acetylase RimI-like enzyme
MPQFAIRPCEFEDLSAVRELLQQLSTVAEPAGDLRLEVMTGILREMVELPGLYFNLVATVEGSVVGFVSVLFYKTLFHRGGTALINELVIDRDWRGQGLGRALIQAVIAEAKSRGIDEVEVSTEQTNHAALRFYRRCGFDEEYVLLGMEFDERHETQ